MPSSLQVTGCTQVGLSIQWDQSGMVAHDWKINCLPVVIGIASGWQSNIQ
jgi:hypothetical protein